MRDALRPIVEAFERALRREVNNLSARPDLLWQQLYNRLPPPEEGSTPRYPSPPRPWIRLVRRYGEEESLIRTVSEARGVWVDQSGRLVTAVGPEAGGTTEVIDLETGEHRHVESERSRRPPEPDDEAQTRLGQSADRSRFATIDAQHVLRVWTVPDGRLVGAQDCSPFEPTCVALDRDGSTLACAVVGDSDLSGRVVVWDIETSRITAFVHDVAAFGKRGAPASCALSDDGTLLALGDEEGNVEVWAVDEDEPTLIAEFGEQLEQDHNVGLVPTDLPFAFSRDNCRLAHGGVYGAAVRVWDLARKEMTHELFGLFEIPEELVFGLTGETLAAAGLAGVCAWDLSVTQESSEAGHRLRGTLEFAAVSPSGCMVLLSYGGGTSVVRIDSGPTSEEERHPHHAAWPSEVCRVDRPEQQLIAAAFGPGDELLAGVDSGGVLYVWDLDDGEELAQIDLASEIGKERYDGEAAVVFGPDSLLACVVDDWLYACDWTSENVLASNLVSSDDMRWTRDGRFVALGRCDPACALDVEEDELLTGDDALQAVTSAYGGREVVARLRDFASLDPHERLGVRRFGSIRGQRDEMVRISRLDGHAEVSWPAESPLYDVRFVEPGERVVAATLAGTITVLKPVFSAA